MAIKSITPRKDALTHTANVAGRSYTVQLIAVVDDLATGPKALRDQLAGWGFVAGQAYQWPLPPATPTETDLAARLTTMEVEQDASDGKNYKIKLTYATADPEKDNGAQGGGASTGWVMNPLTAAPTIEWSSEDREFHQERDRDGNPIVNSAGDPFDPLPSVPVQTPIATIQRVEASWNPAWISSFKGRVNDSAWMGFPAESVLCQNVAAKQVNDPDWGTLWSVTYTLAFRPPILSPTDEPIVPGWALLVANLGRRAIVAGKPVEIRDKDGQPISDAVFLDPDDGSYDRDSPPAANYITVNVHQKADFSFFNFPPSLFNYSPGP